MVLVFTKEATKFVIGKYDSDGTISFEGTIGESSRSAIKNTLRILSQQDQKIKQVIQLSLNSLSNPIIIIDNSGESTLNFLVIMNRIFENSKAQESVVFKLRELLIEHDDSLLEERLKYLQELEALFLERKAEEDKKSTRTTLPRLPDLDPEKMTDTQMRQAVVTLTKQVRELALRVQRLEDAQKLRIVPLSQGEP